MAEPRQCRGVGCRAKIVDAVDEKGRRIVVDAANHPIYVIGDDGVARRVEGARISHFVTCPDRERFRRG